MFAMKKTRTSALWTAALSAVAAAGLFASCDKTPSEPVTPPVVWPEAEEGLANQYQFQSAETVDIKSVVYDYSEDSQAYLFVFSTVEGAEEVEATLKNDSKAFGVIVPTLDGAVDTTKTWGLASADQSFSVTYDKLTGNEHSAKLSFKLAEDGKLVASVEYIGETPDTYFFLKYEGACTKQYHEPTLVNQMLREDRKVTDLKSLVIQTKRSHYYPEDNTLAFSFYKEEGITADNVKESSAGPCLLVMLGKVLDVEEVNFGSYEGVYTVMAGNLYFDKEYPDGATAEGTYKFTEKENGDIDLELNFSTTDSEGTKTVKAVYSGAYTTLVNAYGYSYGTSFGIVPKNVFREKTADGVRYVFGSNVEATAPEQLKEGDFAVSVTIPADGLGDEYELKTATACKVELYDYKTYTTSVYDKDNLGAYGCVYIEEGEDDGKVFTQLEELEFADGVELDGSAYSTIVDATIPDLTPVKPFTPTITITNEDGTQVLFQETITRMEVAHIKGERDFAGSLITGYLFYFVNAKSEDDVDTAKYPNTPLFVLPEIQFGKENVDLYTAKGDGMELCWSLAFNNSNLSAGAQSTSPAQGTYGYNLMGGYINRLPDYAVLTTKKDGANWDFKLVLKDWGCFTMFDTVTKSGTNNILTIEWHGPATKYSGTKYTNTFTDEDYK